MTEVAGQTFGLIGALRQYPRRIIAREVARQGAELLHRVTRRTTCVVFGRSLIFRLAQNAIEAQRHHQLSLGRQVMSEFGFLRRLGVTEVPAGRSLSRQSILDQARISATDFDLLSVFDAFESDQDPYTFRDLILARKYAQLLKDGATWVGIAKSVERGGAPSVLTSLTLQQARGETIYAKSGDLLAELDGQALLPLGPDSETDNEETFAQAESAEDEGEFTMAAGLYARCLAIDPSDAVAAFNRANCLRAASEIDEAHRSYLRAIKLDPNFVEAWFNLGLLEQSRGNIAAARRYLSRSIYLDPSYADAVFNLASIEFKAGHLDEARRWWTRYLELDSVSEWARKAVNGIRYVDYQLRQPRVR